MAREKIKTEIKRLQALSPCLLKATGLDQFLANLTITVDKTHFRIGILNSIGLGGEAAAKKSTVLLSKTPSSVAVDTLFHELIHVFDYQNNIYLDKYWSAGLGSGNYQLRQAETLAYGAQHLINAYETLATTEKFIASVTEGTQTVDDRCDRLQREFIGAYNNLNSNFTVFVSGGIEFQRGPVPLAWEVSIPLGLNFSCKRLLHCFKLPECCTLKCPDSDVYSKAR